MSFPCVRLEEVCDFLSGFAWSASEFDSEPTGLPIIRIQNVDAVRESDFVYWSGAYDERFVIRSGDILLTLSGSFRAEVWPGPDALLNQRIVKLTPKSATSRDWLLYVVRHKLTEIAGMGRHALVSNVALADLRALSVPLPPLPEQRRIAAILDKADALRTQRREALAQLDRLEQSIFVDMFGHPAENPKNWVMKPLKSLGRVSTGGTPPSGEDGMFGGDIPFVTPGDLESDLPAKRTLTEVGAKVVVTVRPGSALVCCIGTIGKMGVATTRCAFNQQINAIEWFADAIDDTFGLAALRFFKPTIVAWGSATTLPILKKSSFEKIEIPVPPIELQREFSQRMRRLLAIKSKHQEENVLLTTLFNSLQSRAFEGEL